MASRATVINEHNGFWLCFNPLWLHWRTKTIKSTAPPETKRKLLNLAIQFTSKWFFYCLLLYGNFKTLKYVLWVLELWETEGIWFYGNFTALFHCSLYTAFALRRSSRISLMPLSHSKFEYGWYYVVNNHATFSVKWCAEHMWFGESPEL